MATFNFPCGEQRVYPLRAHFVGITCKRKRPESVTLNRQDLKDLLDGTQQRQSEVLLRLRNALAEPPEPAAGL